MRNRRLKLFLLLLTIISGISIFASADIDIESEKVKPDSHQKSVLRNTVKALLDFKTLPNPNDVIRPMSRTGNAASQFMRQLFEKYRDHEIGASGKNSLGNIVRSVSPSIGMKNGKDTLEFSLHKVGPTEEIIRAEIHYNLRSRKRHWKHHQKKTHLLKQTRCFIWSNSPTVPTRLEIPAVKFNSDWVSYDATDALISQLQLRHNQTDQSKRLAVSFARMRKRGELKFLAADKVLRRHLPFLLIYSNQKSLVNKEEVMSSVYDSTPSDKVEPEDELKRVRRSLPNNPDYYAYGKPHENANTFFDQPPHVELHVRAFQSEGPDVLSTRKELRRQRKQKQKLRKNRRRNYQSRRNEIARPNGYSGAEEFGTYALYETRATTTPRMTVLEIPQMKPDQFSQPDVVLLGSQGIRHPYELDLCRKRHLTVAFKELGWGNWIIAPSSFEGHFCAGSCPFPLPPESNPSNHASIQSIIHAIGLNPAVPAVCCAPEKMDSLSLLFFDEDENVVLKNFPKMTISSCGCM